MTATASQSRVLQTMTGTAKGLRLSGLNTEIVNVTAVAHYKAGRGGWEQRLRIVGLPPSANRSTTRRIAAALAIHYHEQPVEFTVNITPELTTDDDAMDLAIAVAILRAGLFIRDRSDDIAFIGRIDVNGEVHTTQRVPAILAGLEEDISVVAPADEEHAGIIAAHRNVAAAGTTRLVDVSNWLNGGGTLCDFVATPVRDIATPRDTPDFANIAGQTHMRLAAEVAAAGGHSLLMSGVAGAGKSTIAKAINGILPPLNDGERVDLLHIANAYGMPYTGGRPFRSPHHKSSAEALLGGGSSGAVSIGEVTLAHRGVLFLDELPEFNHAALEALREPMQDRCVTISRARQKVQYPAEFMLVAAMNPCPCGHYDGVNDICTCKISDVQRYQRRLSAPLLDRFDMTVQAQRVTITEIANAPPSESSQVIRERVIASRQMQADRYEDQTLLNSRVRVATSPVTCKVSNKVLRYAQVIAEDNRMSMRSYEKLLQVSRTVADITQSDDVTLGHVDTASSLVSPIGTRKELL